jgi:hypothetical protein
MSLNKSVGRKDIRNSGYYRVFAENNEDTFATQLASMISKIQACVISNGCILDGHLIPSSEFNPNNVIKNTTSTTHNTTSPNGHYSKFKILKSDWNSITGKNAIELDYLVVSDDNIEIYEIKDGDNFDTKKSKSEIDCLKTASAYFASIFPNKTMFMHIVLWNATDIKKTSFKVKDLDASILMTGKTFADKVNCDFDAINEYRRQHASQNKEWICNEFNTLINNS